MKKFVFLPFWQNVRIIYLFIYKQTINKFQYITYTCYMLKSNAKSNNQSTVALIVSWKNNVQDES